MTSSSTSDHPLRRLWQYARGHRRSILIATIFSILNKIFDLAPPALIGVAVDVVVNQEDSFLARAGIVDPADQLLLLAGLTVAAWGLESSFDYLMQVKWRNLAQTCSTSCASTPITTCRSWRWPTSRIEHRRPDGHSQRRHQPAGALPRRGRQRHHPG
jgi:hypothetical protein